MGRTYYTNELTVVTYFSKEKKAYITFYGKVIEVYSFQILINRGDFDAVWNRVEIGSVPLNALPCGLDEKGRPLYVARVKYNGVRLPGKYFPSQKSCYYKGEDTEKSTQVCDVLVNKIDGYDWIYTETGKKLPEGAFACGKDAKGNDIFVGSTFHVTEKTLVKIIPNIRKATIGYYGKEIDVTSFYTFVYNGYRNLKWIKMAEDITVSQMIQCGYDNTNGSMMFIGRYSRNGEYVPGKVFKNGKIIYIPFNGKEESYTKDIEILILDE